MTAPSAGFPDWVVPMAATLTQERFTGPEWVFERKVDGIRLLAFKDGAGVRLLSRNQLPQRCPRVAAAVAALPVRDVILDGELEWSGTAYHVFDVLWLDGRDLRALPLDARREVLAALPLRAPLARVTAVGGPQPWERACREGWEGVIAKRRDAPYESRRSRHWLKMKCEATQELVVGGFTEPKGRRVGLGALLVGYYDGGDFVFAGKVGTGLDTALLSRLRARLGAIGLPAPPFTRGTGLPRKDAHWAKPELVVQVAFIEWTVHGKLRHARLLGLREDKAPREVVRDVITHPEKILFPEDGITKGDLAAYYEAVAAVMLPHLRGRPVTLERYPSGIGRKGFWQKDVSRGFPEWLSRVEVPKKDGAVHHPLAGDTRSLLWMANQNSITLHVWPSRVPTLLQPDLCLFDLDPAADDPATARAATLEVRDLLAELGLRSWVKTTGSKGFHVAVPLDGAAGFEEVAGFAHRAGALLVKRNPRRLTREFLKADRGGRVLVDTGRNGWSATFAAAYTVRARAGAPVSAPCTWAEVERGAIEPRSVTLRSMAARLAAVGDLWSDLAAGGQSLRGPLERLAQL